MTISERSLYVAIALGIALFESAIIGTAAAFSPQKPLNRKTVAGYSSDENLHIPSNYAEGVGKFCDEILCSYDDYEEIIYKLRVQREALVRRTEIIDDFLSTLHATLEEDLIGTDPSEITTLAARARVIFQVERLRLDRGETSQKHTPSGRFIPQPPNVPPTLSHFLALRCHVASF